MDKLTFQNTYWNYYKQLESDFFSYSPYCEIDACNQKPDSLEDYSGQFKLRIPCSLHRLLAEHSKREGISIVCICIKLKQI